MARLWRTVLPAVLAAAWMVYSGCSGDGPATTPDVAPEAEVAPAMSDEMLLSYVEEVGKRHRLWEENRLGQWRLQEPGQAETVPAPTPPPYKGVRTPEATSKEESALPAKEQWSKGKDDRLSPEDSALERTVRLVEDSGGKIYYLDHIEREDRTVLVTPLEFVDGETPLIVSLHGFGGNSADQAAYVPLHERVNSDGFALLLPNGTRDDDGNRFWNPTDRCCDSGKTGEDDVAYLTELVAEAKKIKDFGPVYFFGYSNGGFMSYHIACKGLPGLRAVASLAGTSYVEDSSCGDAPGVSVLHIHGTADAVILFEGDQSEPDPEDDGEPAFYTGARDMVMRWGRMAGCDWPEHLQPYATLDLDQYVPGSETQAFRLELGCAEGINIELWMGVGSSHSPGYGDAFVDALLDWILSQE